MVIVGPANPTVKVTVQTAICFSSQCSQPAEGAKALESSENYIWSFGEDNHGNLYLVHSSLGLYRVVANDLCSDLAIDRLSTYSPTSAAVTSGLYSFTILIGCLALLTSAN